MQESSVDDISLEEAEEDYGVELEAEDGFIEYSEDHDFGEDQNDDQGSMSAANELLQGTEAEDQQHTHGKMETDLLFHVQELGGIGKLYGREIYEVMEYTENGLKDILKMLQEDDFSKPFVRLRLLRWNVIKANLIPLTLTQRENKTILYRILVVLAYLLEPTTATDLVEFKHAQEFMELLEAVREPLTDRNFITALVMELSDIIKKPIENRTETENHTTEFIITILRNIVVLPVKDRYFNSVTDRLIDIFASNGGVFHAIVYLTQDINQQSKRHSMLFGEIIAALTGRVDVKYVMEGMDSDEVAKRIREINKLKQIERRAASMSSRHSRFGAMITVKDKKGGRRFISNPGQLKQSPKNEVKNKFYRPKQWMKERYLDGKVRGLLTEKIRERPSELTKKALRAFFIDFLKHSCVPLVETIYQDVFASASSELKLSDFVAFFELLSFGIKAGLVKNKETGVPYWVVRCVGVLYIDIACAKLQEELSKRKKEANYFLAGVCYMYLYEVLRATRFFCDHDTIPLKQNGKVLEKVLFGKDFTKIFRDLFELFGRRSPRLIVLGPTLFYRLLANQGRNKVLTLRTQKVIEDDVPDTDEYDEEEGGERVIYQERRFNYTTEVSAFVTPAVIEGYLEWLRDDAVVTNPKEVNEAILDFLTMVMDDLSATWAFFQIDFLERLESFVTTQAAAIATDEVLALIRKKAINIFSEFQRCCILNPLLPVEIMFRWRNYSDKENILSNYSHVRIVNPADDAENAQKLDILLPEQQIIASSSVNVWSYEEDLQLIEAYYKYKTAPNLLAVLTNFLNSTISNYKSSEEIQTRIGKLGLEKADLEAAKLKIEGRKKQVNNNAFDDASARFCRRNKENLVDMLAKSLDFMDGVIGKFQAFKDRDPTDMTDFSIVPGTEDDCEMINRLADLFDVFGFLRPKKGILFWRMPYYHTKERLDELVQRFLESCNQYHASGGKRQSSGTAREVKKERKERPAKTTQRRSQTKKDDFIDDEEGNRKLKVKRQVESSDESIELKIESEDDSVQLHPAVTATSAPGLTRLKKLKTTHKSDNLYAMMTGHDRSSDEAQEAAVSSPAKRPNKNWLLNDEDE